jgi:hypothetical protein
MARKMAIMRANQMSNQILFKIWWQLLLLLFVVSLYQHSQILRTRTLSLLELLTHQVGYNSIMNTEVGSMFNNKEEPIIEERVSKKNKLTNNNLFDGDIIKTETKDRRSSECLTVTTAKLKINWTTNQCSIASNEISETVTVDSVGSTTIGNNESIMKKKWILMLEQMSHEFIESARWRNKIMNEKERWIRHVCDKSGLKKEILKLRYLEDRCRVKSDSINLVLIY